MTGGHPDEVVRGGSIFRKIKKEGVGITRTQGQEAACGGRICLVWGQESPSLNSLNFPCKVVKDQLKDSKFPQWVSH